MRKTLLCLACLLAAATSHAEIGAPCHSAAAIPQALSAGQRGTFEYATQLFVERRFAAAYGRPTQLADAGHLPAAQLALFMAQQAGACLEASGMRASRNSRTGMRWWVAQHRRRRGGIALSPRHPRPSQGSGTNLVADDSRQRLRAALAFAAEMMRDEEYVAIHKAAA